MRQPPWQSEHMSQDENQPAAPVSVLLVVDDDTRDRLQLIVRHLCVGIMDEPVRMRVLAWTKHRYEDDRIGPVQVIYPPEKRWYVRGPSVEEVVDQIEAPRPEVVHCLSARSALLMLPHAEMWKAHLLVHLTDEVDLEDFGRLMARPRVSGVLTTGALERLYRTRYPGAIVPVSTVPLGLPAQSDPSCLSRPERVPAFVVTTLLTRDCGLDHLLRAWHDVVRSGQETQLFILGQGPAERYFRRMMERLDVRSHVTFAGGMGSWSSLHEAMRGADFYVLPAPHARFTMMTLSAMASGLTVIAPTGLTEDYVIDGETACLFTPGRSDDLSDKIMTLLNDHRWARRLAHGGQDYIRSHHQASAMVHALAALYRERTSSDASPSEASEAPANALASE